jgi:hypothetical protein
MLAFGACLVAHDILVLVWLAAKNLVAYEIFATLLTLIPSQIWYEFP